MAKMINGRTNLVKRLVVPKLYSESKEYVDNVKKDHAEEIALYLGKAMIERMSGGVPMVLEIIEYDEQKLQDGSVELTTNAIIGRLEECTEENAKAAPDSIKREFTGIENLASDALRSSHWCGKCAHNDGRSVNHVPCSTCFHLLAADEPTDGFKERE